MVVVVVVLTVAVIVLSVLIAIGWAPLAGLDADVALGLAAVMPAHPVLVTVMIVVTDVGSPVGVNLLTGTAVVVLLLRRRVRVAAYLTAVRLCVLVVETALKHGLGRPRPPVHPLTSASGFSFPSGHAGGTAGLCVSALLVLLPVVHRRWRIAAVAAAVLLSVAVAASRVVLGVAGCQPPPPTACAAGRALRGSPWAVLPRAVRALGLPPPRHAAVGRSRNERAGAVVYRCRGAVDGRCRAAARRLPVAARARTAGACAGAEDDVRDTSRAGSPCSTGPTSARPWWSTSAR